MKHLLLCGLALMALSVSPQISATAVNAKLESLSKYKYIHVSLGHHQMDEYIFQKGKLWKVDWVDRGQTQKIKHTKRVIPAPIAQKMIVDLEMFLRKNQKALKYETFMGCSFRMSLRVGDSKLRSFDNVFCLDRLEKSADQELNGWIIKFSEHFRF